MKTIFKIPERLYREAMHDLARPHPFAYERVGFLACRAAMVNESTLLVLATAYEQIPDDEYLEDDTVGASIGPDAIRRALSLGLAGGRGDVSVFHVHRHRGRGLPRFSMVDSEETKKFVPDFFHTAAGMPHGAVIFSDTHACGRVWLAEKEEPKTIQEIITVGGQIKFLHLL